MGQGFCSALIAQVFLLGVAPAYGQEPVTPAVIVTMGRASGAVPPTAARLSLGIDSRASSASAAAADNGSRQRQLLAALGRLGFGPDEARMTSYSVRADKDYESGKLRYYEATTTVEVAIGSLAALGMTIDSALAAGATEIKSLDFLADSLEPLRARLLARLGGVVDHGRMSVKHVRPEDAC